MNCTKCKKDRNGFSVGRFKEKEFRLCANCEEDFEEFLRE